VKNLNEYLKYYWLEKYLEDEVKPFFDRKHYITAEQFFAIIIWKRNASKTKIREGIEKSHKTIFEITSEIYRAESLEGKMKILIAIDGISYSFASAILTILYPELFTISDYRVSRSLKEQFNINAPETISTKTEYFAYLNACKKLSEKNRLSLRDCDRALWGRDFYEGKQGLKSLANGL